MIKQWDGGWVQNIKRHHERELYARPGGRLGPPGSGAYALGARARHDLATNTRTKRRNENPTPMVDHATKNRLSRINSAAVNHNNVGRTQYERKSLHNPSDDSRTACVPPGV